MVPELPVHARCPFSETQTLLSGRQLGEFKFVLGEIARRVLYEDFEQMGFKLGEFSDTLQTIRGQRLADCGMYSFSHT